MAFESERLADHRGVAAVTALPEGVADVHDTRTPGLLILRIIGWGNQTAEDRLHAQHLEELSADPNGLSVINLAAFSEVQSAPPQAAIDEKAC